MSSQESQQDSSSSSADEHCANNVKKRKLNAHISKSPPPSFKKVILEEESTPPKKIIEEEDIIPPPMQTLLGELSDEIIEHILEFIPNRKSISIPLSCVSQQFRRVWKKTTFGIVYNMIIELNYNFLKRSYSLDDKIEIGTDVKEIIKEYFDSNEKEKENEFHAQKTNLLIEKLKSNENVSQNFTNAISKITRFDYGEESEVENGFSMGTSEGMEIEFENPDGLIKYWNWDQIHVKHGSSKSCSTMSKSLLDLKLTNDEWNIIISTAGEYINADWLYYYSFKLKKEVSSVFDGHSLDVGSELN